MLRAELIAVVHTRLKQLDDIGGVISAATFLPALPRRHQTIERAQYRSRLEQRRAELVEEGYLAQVRDGEFWRISARIPAIHDDDYEVFVRKVQDCVEQTRGAWVEATGGRVAPDAVQASYTGLLPLVHGAQRQLLHDLVKSFSLALVLIFPIMVLALGSFVFGLAAMIPNVAPVAIVFGAMGWLNIPVDIGAMLTASVALGIAIDDTLHFLTWYRRGFSAGKTSGEAVRYAFQRCSTAMIQTTIITSLGMLVLVRSNYVPTGHFALLMALMLSAALIGDLLLLPAILAGPLRRVLQRGPAETC